MLSSPLLDNFHDYFEVFSDDHQDASITADACTQTDINMDHMLGYSDAEIKDPKVLKRNDFIRTIKSDDGTCKFYTGLTTSLFAIILNLLMTKAKRLNYWRGSDTAGLTEDHGQKPGRRGHHLDFFYVPRTSVPSILANSVSSSISDRKIVQQSGFLDKLEYGDDIMADRGFLIRDLLTKRMCTLNIPPFSMALFNLDKKLVK
ncbi:uncharacterized protein LOC124283907 [Haliotis rubra]|uniref:uncharacterized protein LOC124283907 n=1 Tax=Haliotis rubra TaxID=36100 RepID=UPI001EE5C7B0|nr:uncharacterized protein LOC124283907 [Haliotis rubra]